MSGLRALFLDRDGVINIDKGYVHRPEDCEFVSGIQALIGRANRDGLKVFIVTNQAGIARGYYSEAQFLHFTSWMLHCLGEQGAYVDRVYFCPHHPTAGLGGYLQDCECRKPRPGMFRQAMSDFDIDMDQSVMVGDTLNDMQAAAAVGIQQRYLFLPDGDPTVSGTGYADSSGVLRISDLACVQWN